MLLTLVDTVDAALVAWLAGGHLTGQGHCPPWLHMPSKPAVKGPSLDTTPARGLS